MSKILNLLIAYESGELNDAETLNLFSELVKSKMAWQLQGHYGRTAQALIHDGWLEDDGTITDKCYINGILV